MAGTTKGSKAPEETPVRHGSSFVDLRSLELVSNALIGHTPQICQLPGESFS